VINTFPVTIRFTKVVEWNDTISSKNDSPSNKSTPKKGIWKNAAIPKRAVHKKDTVIFLEKSFDKIFSDLRRNDIFKYHIITDTNRNVLYSDDGLINPLGLLDTSLGKNIDKFNSSKKITIAG